MTKNRGLFGENTKFYMPNKEILQKIRKTSCDFLSRTFHAIVLYFKFFGTHVFSLQTEAKNLLRRKFGRTGLVSLVRAWAGLFLLQPRCGLEMNERHQRILQFISPLSRLSRQISA
jgi:hypothetical protein